MQTSIVFSQRTWPGHDPNPADGRPDLDDCWAVSGIQLGNVTAPWLRLPSVAAFRNAAGIRDTAAGTEGGRIGPIVRGCRAVYPSIAQLVHGRYGVAVDEFRGELEQHRPLSVSIVSGELPERLRYGFNGLHQVTIAERGGRVRIANPLQRCESRWESIGFDDIRRAAMAYGRLRNPGDPGVWYAAGPTDSEARATILMHPLPPDDPGPDEPGDSAELAELRDRIARGVAVLTGSD